MARDAEQWRRHTPANLPDVEIGKSGSFLTSQISALNAQGGTGQAQPDRNERFNDVLAACRRCITMLWFQDLQAAVVCARTTADIRVAKHGNMTQHSCARRERQCDVCTQRADE
jgi:hypothetical protein